jgi:hypothetical protein
VEDAFPLFLKLTPDHHHVRLGPLGGPSPSLLPNPASSADWSPACWRAGPDGPDVTDEGGGRLGEGGDGARLSTSESSLPGLFCFGIAAGGGSEGAGHRESRQRDGREGVEALWQSEGSAVIRRGGRGAGPGEGHRAAAAVAAHLDGNELCPHHHGSGAALQESIFP